ncbi:MAG: hypothetical protein IIC90_08595 [Chloroflexi bacterium]|nr:hypothetical protein [Chloroflexota bacterium]
MAQLQILINDAVQDASNSGWLIPLEDDTIAVAAGAVAVPADFAFIKEIRITATDIRIERHYWYMEIRATDPSFIFDPSVRPTGAATVTGWRRPTVYSEVGDTVDAGLEAFLRERGAAYALGYLAAGTSELDRYRGQHREMKMRDSLALLDSRPTQFKSNPVARYVPGR